MKLQRSIVFVILFAMASLWGTQWANAALAGIPDRGGPCSSAEPCDSGGMAETYAEDELDTFDDSLLPPLVILPAGSQREVRIVSRLLEAGRFLAQPDKPPRLFS